MQTAIFTETNSNLSGQEVPGRFLLKLCMLVFLGITGINSAFAQTNYSVKSVKATVNGTSNLHDWESEITKIECKGTFQSVNNTLKTIKNVFVKIAVEGIKSKEGKIMDNKTYDAFNADKNPFITYIFSSAQVKTDAMRSVTIEASGNLTMAGTTKLVSITAKGKVLANGDLQLSGSKKLKMTEYKMKPPSAVLGTIKVGDEITVNFELVLTKSPQQAVKTIIN
ncbi:MAG: YceI family protein [Bacteroidia bacterium]